MTNATQSPAQGVEVTQADREAAKSLLGRDDSGPSWWSIDSGNADSDPLVQAFARHRIAHSTPPAQPEDGSGEVERLREALAYIRKQWPDSFAARHASAALAIKGGE